MDFRPPKLMIFKHAVAHCFAFLHCFFSTLIFHIVFQQLQDCCLASVDPLIQFNCENREEEKNCENRELVERSVLPSCNQLLLYYCLVLDNAVCHIDLNWLKCPRFLPLAWALFRKILKPA